MGFNFYLSAEEERAIHDVLERFSARAKYTLSLEQLVQKWSTFISRVEQGYTSSIYDYMNDLATRDVIEEILQVAPQSLHAKLLMTIQPLDRKFQELTQMLQRPIDPIGKARRTNPWWFCVPKNLKPQLQNDLRAHLR